MQSKMITLLSKVKDSSVKTKGISVKIKDTSAKKKTRK